MVGPGGIVAKRYSELTEEEKEKRRERARKWNKENQDRYRENLKVWNDLNKEKKNEYLREWRDKNKEKVISHGVRAKQFRVKKYMDFMEGKSCEKCGEKRTYCLEWHHINPSEKEEYIPVLVRKHEKDHEKIKKELEKCQVLCANCHREVHYLMRNGEDDV
jgi:hypothetical protein